MCNTGCNISLFDFTSQTQEECGSTQFLRDNPHIPLVSAETQRLSQDDGKTEKILFDSQRTGSATTEIDSSNCI